MNHSHFHVLVSSHKLHWHFSHFSPFYISIGQLCHKQTEVQTTPTHLCTCALVFTIRCIDIQQDQEKSLRTFSVRIWGRFPLSFCVRVLACTCFMFLSFQLWRSFKQVAESNSQQMPSHRVKISLPAVFARQKERNANTDRQHPFHVCISP